MIIAGVDEAGRGPVFGPLVLGIALIEKKKEDTLLDIGVKDSKQLTAQQRNVCLKHLVKMLYEFSTTALSPQEIDSLRDRRSLNEIEAMRIGFLLENLNKKPEVVYIDSPDNISGNFAKRVKKYISFNCVIKAEHKADSRYPIVSAASIIAKVERDKHIENLSKQYGSIGSGYPSDEKTIAFLRNWVKKFGSLPPFSRRSWNTSKNVLDEFFQKSLADFGK